MENVENKNPPDFDGWTPLHLAGKLRLKNDLWMPIFFRSDWIWGIIQHFSTMQMHWGLQDDDRICRRRPSKKLTRWNSSPIGKAVWTCRYCSTIWSCWLIVSIMWKIWRIHEVFNSYEFFKYIYLCNVEKQSLQTRFTQWYLSKMGRNSPIFDFETRTATILTEVGSHYIW